MRTLRIAKMPLDRNGNVAKSFQMRFGKTLNSKDLYRDLSADDDSRATLKQNDILVVIEEQRDIQWQISFFRILFSDGKVGWVTDPQTWGYVLFEEL